MKIALTCRPCTLTAVTPEELPIPIWMEYRDDSTYEFTCEADHRTVAILQQQKFEILFQIGAYAILDGYYREAVTSFSSSLERVFEFFIKAKLSAQHLSEEQVNSAWKLIAQQSERQLGAFIFLYLQSFDTPPSLLSSKNTQFRNEVVHKGKIPSREEACAYGQSVLEVARSIIDKINTAFPDEATNLMESFLLKHLKRDPSRPYERTTSLSMPTIISAHFKDETGPQTTLLEELEHLKAAKELWK